MHRVTMKFEEVKLRGVRRWKVDGNWKQKTKVFYQTINPFNKDAEGNPKSRRQIWEELLRQRDAWYALPIEEAIRG